MTPGQELTVLLISAKQSPLKTYLFPLAPAGASVLLLFSNVPIASRTSGSLCIVFCTSHSFILPLTSPIACSSPINGLSSSCTALVASTSTIFAVASNLSSCCFICTSGLAFDATGVGGSRCGPICENAM